MKPRTITPLAAPVTPEPEQGLPRRVFEDLVFVAVMGQCKLPDVAAAAALTAWDKWQSARAAKERSR